MRGSQADVWGTKTWRSAAIEDRPLFDVRKFRATNLLSGSSLRRSHLSNLLNGKQVLTAILSKQENVICPSALHLSASKPNIQRILCWTNVHQKKAFADLLSAMPCVTNHVTHSIWSKLIKTEFKQFSNLPALLAHQGPKFCTRGLVAFVELCFVCSPFVFRADWAAASRATGTLKGEQLT